MKIIDKPKELAFGCQSQKPRLKFAKVDETVLMTKSPVCSMTVVP